jgi:mannitol-specific phosphotransferase system IIBC component
VAVAASFGFLVGVGATGVRFDYVVALLLGGLIASPIAAYLVRHLNSRFLGVIVGGFICFTNARILLIAVGVTGDAFLATYLVIIGSWIAAVAIVLRRLRRERGSNAA